MMDSLTCPPTARSLLTPPSLVQHWETTKIQLHQLMPSLDLPDALWIRFLMLLEKMDFLLISRLIDVCIHRDNHSTLRPILTSLFGDVNHRSFMLATVNNVQLASDEVEQMVPLNYRYRKNKEGHTAYDLFPLRHEDLVRKGEVWMKDTTSQCMVVSTLIATIVFAAAFTLPGGYNQNTGIPFFKQKPSLIVFVIVDAVSLIFSSTSVLMFLSILTSRFAERDFLESLPKKLMLGLATLFLSIITMMVAFSASFFLLYNNDMQWLPVIITILAGVPVIVYAIVQFRLLGDVFYSTYQSRYLFKPKKDKLFE